MIFQWVGELAWFSDIWGHSQALRRSEGAKNDLGNGWVEQNTG